MNNALLMIGMAIALMNFKPQDTTAKKEEQCTQGYYAPRGEKAYKRKMGSTNAIKVPFQQGFGFMPANGVPVGEYFVGDAFTPTGRYIGRYAMEQMQTRSRTIEVFNLNNYWVGNCV